MTKLQYRLTNDILFKMLFVKYPELLKKLVAELLSIKYTDIQLGLFIKTNRKAKVLTQKELCEGGSCIFVVSGSFNG